MSLEPIPGVQWIAAGYKARHGKGTACDVIHSMIPRASLICAFADSLKAVCRYEYGMTRKDGNLLQGIGSQARETNADIWIRNLYWMVEEFRPQVVLISDLRYRNEAAFIKRMAGTLIKVERRNADGSLFIDPSRSATHQSETALDTYTDWDYTLHNNRSAAEFEGEVSRWWNEHGNHILEKKAA